MSSFFDLNPIIQGFLATSFTWSVTALGASFGFLLKDINRKIFDSMLGFAAGVACCKLLVSSSPSLELSKLMPYLATSRNWFFIRRSIYYSDDKILPHLHPNLPPVAVEGPKTKLKNITY